MSTTVGCGDEVRRIPRYDDKDDKDGPAGMGLLSSLKIFINIVSEKVVALNSRHTQRYQELEDHVSNCRIDSVTAIQRETQSSLKSVQSELAKHKSLLSTKTSEFKCEVIKNSSLVT